MIDPKWANYAAWLDQRYPNPQPNTMIYLSAPYSRVADKDELMAKIMTFSGRFMLTHPGQHICSPLFNHYSLDRVPELGTDYAFWKAYSANMLGRCDRMIVLEIDGWLESTGVADEIRIAGLERIPVEYVSSDLFAALTQTPSN